MSAIEAISSVGIAPDALVDPSQNNLAQNAQVEQTFSELLAQGLDMVETKVTEANTLAREFAVNDSIPIHQVTIALEEARMAVELAMQVRTRLIEGYREIMNMQM